MKSSASLAVLVVGRRSSLPTTRLLFSAVLLASVSTAEAETITYNLIPYYHSDLNHQSDMDTLAGTITVSSDSSVIGTWNPSSPPPTDMTMAFDLRLSNDTEPGAYPAVQAKQTFLVTYLT